MNYCLYDCDPEETSISLLKNKAELRCFSKSESAFLQNQNPYFAKRYGDHWLAYEDENFLPKFMSLFFDEVILKTEMNVVYLI